MPNRLFDCRKMRPKALRTQVELGPALTMRQCVNEVPSLAAFKRQATLRTGMQHRTRTPLTTIDVKVNTRCCIAKADGMRTRPWKTIGPATIMSAFQARAAPRDQITFIAVESDLISGMLPPFG